MKGITFCLIAIMPAVSACLLAQTATSTSDSLQPPAQVGNQVPASPYGRAPRYAEPEPFSRLAFSAGVGLGGINLQTAVEANRYLNVRGIGNVFSYSVNNVKINGNNGSNGVDVSGKLNFASMGVALDYYPFPSHGFRLSPGLMLYNQNGASASGVASPGSSITLGSQQYYSDFANPMSVTANLGLNAHRQAFTLTTGWGNMISRSGGHLSFPFELGAIFTGAPTVNLTLAGNACLSQADANDNGPSCVNMASNAIAQTNLNAQIAKYESDLNALKVWPILSFGVAFNFGIH